jgi:hypothetical protein
MVTCIYETGTMLALISNVPSSPILVGLMMEAIWFSETPVLTRAIMLIVTSDISNSSILVTLIMEAIGSFETFLTRTTRRNIPVDGILQYKRRFKKKEKYLKRE